MKKANPKFMATRNLHICAIAFFLSALLCPICKGAEKNMNNKETTLKKLVDMGFENIRCTDTESERIYTIENNVYKTQGAGIAKAIEVIQSQGLPALHSHSALPFISPCYFRFYHPGLLSGPTTHHPLSC